VSIVTAQDFPPVNGEADGWRWAVVDDQVAIDNMPEIKAHDSTYSPPPAYQNVIIPASVIQQAAMHIVTKGRLESD
jgi:hypothetical protein